MSDVKCVICGKPAVATIGSMIRVCGSRKCFDEAARRLDEAKNKMRPAGYCPGHEQHVEASDD